MKREKKTGRAADSADRDQNQDQNRNPSANIQWFPGHMAKARRLLTENLSKVDAVVELLDARAVSSSENPEIDRILKNKPRIVVANKSDLADPAVTSAFVEEYKSRGIRLISVDSRTGADVKTVKAALMELMEEKLSRKKERGMISYTVKTMVVGIPNVGKSTFINRLCGRTAALAGDKPGVTRGEQWLKVDDSIALLDTPGLLWPKFEDRRTGYCLACVGSIKDDILDRAEIASFLLLYILDNYPGVLADKYSLDEEVLIRGGEEEQDGVILSRIGTVGYPALEMAAMKRGCLRKGGAADIERASAMVLDDFRGGKLGRISLDRPVMRSGMCEKTPEGVNAD
ncbi:MAG: ribosome biogenesis GTPase YlqF [Clostridia bacterium]|nr:ribosome biogenesis GTPase YlqF [Clostridia bacterium]